MSIEEYNNIVKVINSNTYEKLIYLEIERHVRSKGYEIPDITYESYIQMRNCLDAMNRVPFAQSIQNIASTGPIPAKKKEKRPKGYFDRLWSTLLITTTLVFLGLILPTQVSFLVYVAAFITFILGIVEYIPLPKHYDSEYVSKYINAQIDARTNTEAYLHQAYLHKDQIRQLSSRINRR